MLIQDQIHQRGGRSSQALSNYNYTNQNRTYSNNNIQTSDSKKRRYNVGRKSDNVNNSNDNVSASRSSNQRTTSSRGSNNINNYPRRSYENRSGSSNNFGTSRYSNYSSGRSIPHHKATVLDQGLQAAAVEVVVQGDVNF